MKRILLALTAVSFALTPAAARDRNERGRGFANPSAVIAAELAFAQLAQEKGQWTAFRATAAKDAVMFAPQMVLAHQWLKDKADPATAVKWQPHQVWSSCDGTMAVTRGAWQKDTTSGYFSTVWQLQKDGRYKWILDQGEPLPMPMDAPEMIVAKVADCPAGYRGKPNRKSSRPAALAFDPAQRAGQSDDGSLTWNVTAKPDGARHFTLVMTIDGQPATVQDLQVEPGKE